VEPGDTSINLWGLCGVDEVSSDMKKGEEGHPVTTTILISVAAISVGFLVSFYLILTHEEPYECPTCTSIQIDQTEDGEDWNIRVVNGGPYSTNYSMSWVSVKSSGIPLIYVPLGEVDRDIPSYNYSLDGSINVLIYPEHGEITWDGGRFVLAEFDNASHEWVAGKDHDSFQVTENVDDIDGIHLALLDMDLDGRFGPADRFRLFWDHDGDGVEDFSRGVDVDVVMGGRAIGGHGTTIK